MPNNPKLSLIFARQLRQSATNCERIIWAYLRNKNLGGYKIYRQFQFNYTNHEKQESFFIFDFYCSARKLAIEIDGSSHDDRACYDAWRDEIVASHRIKTLRIKNEDVINDIDNVLACILAQLQLRSDITD